VVRDHEPNPGQLTAEEQCRGLQVAAGYDYAAAGDLVSGDPAYRRFVDSRGLCLRRDPYGADLRCTRQRGHGGARCVAEGTHEVQAVWSSQESPAQSRR